MSLQGQLATRAALRDLKANPALVLANNAVEIKLSNQMVGHNTQRLRLCLGYRADVSEYHLGDTSTNYAMGQIDQDSLVYIYCLATPMRDSGSVTRLNAVQRFGAANTDFWVTDQQSGCSVLILDWGGGQYSMVHLRPHDDTEFYKLSRGLFGKQGRKVAIKDFWLRRDMSSVVSASLGGGQNPLNYILVQSMSFATHNMQRMQILGVNQGGAWSFYLQKYRRDHHGMAANLHLTALNWAGWGATYGYQTYE